MEILRTKSAVAGMCAAHSALRKKNLYNKNNKFDVCMKKCVVGYSPKRAQYHTT